MPAVPFAFLDLLQPLSVLMEQFLVELLRPFLGLRRLTPKSTQVADSTCMPELFLGPWGWGSPERPGSHTQATVGVLQASRTPRSLAQICASYAYLYLSLPAVQNEETCLF